MTAFPFTVVDAFTERPFAGNPAAVMLLDAFLDDQDLALLAAEHNYAETAFLVLESPGVYKLRWFTPTVEVPLCGHGTLAAAHALFTDHERDAALLRFATQSGTLTVERGEGGYALDLPTDRSFAQITMPEVEAALGTCPEAVLKGNFLMAVLPDEAAVRAVQPDLAAVAQLDADELVVTAPGDKTDFVSRMFGPRIGIPEDPFTGATHTMLTPYWAERLGKRRLTAHQASARGGDAVCEDCGDRVRLLGNAATTMRGHAFF
ncbi:MAG: PhzF family phenazine biosynthesis protein [Pseudomonadota bacterium]